MKTEIINQYRYSQSQTMRGALADAEQGDKIHLFKNVSELRLTYQIRLLSYRANEQRKKLIIHVPKICRLHPSLKEFIKFLERTVRIERV